MGKMKVLLVDDEKDFLDIMSERISRWGYSLIKAIDGKEAIEAVKSKEPDIVVLDYMLPGMDGIAVLKAIRKISKGLPVIMFTAYPDVDVMEDVEKLGISAFIPKLSIYSDTLTSLKASLEMIEKKLAKKD